MPLLGTGAMQEPDKDCRSGKLLYRREELTCSCWSYTSFSLTLQAPYIPQNFAKIMITGEELALKGGAIDRCAM